MTSLINRRWFQFSLRSLLVIVAAMAIVAWYVRPLTSEVHVDGDPLFATDLSEIREIVLGNPKVQYTRVIKIIGVAEGNGFPFPSAVVEVNNGPASKEGQELDVRKLRGSWKVHHIARLDYEQERHSPAP